MADNVHVSRDACSVCGHTDELKRCMRCKVARYCSKEHQVQHWKIHRLECGKQKGRDGAIHAPAGPTKETGRATSASPASVGPQAAGETYVGEPFDERPLKLCDFGKPKSNRDEDMLEYCIERMKGDGFCVLDNVLSEKECKNILAEIEGLESTDKMTSGQLAEKKESTAVPAAVSSKLSNIEPGGRASSSSEEMVVNKNLRGDKIVWLEGNESEYPSISNLVTKRMDGFVLPLTAHFDGEIMLSGRTKAMVACYPGEGTGYRRHVDNPTKDGRIVTCIFYANKDWDTEKSGGALRIFPTSRPGDYVDVAPLMNRMLLFWSDGRTPHEVHPAYATRFAITIWYFDAEERAKAKQAEVNAAIAETEKKVADVQIRTKQMEKEILEKKVAATTSEAIGMLSEEELQALTHMVTVSADPKALLTQLGIAEVLQDSLLKMIRSRQARCNITVLDDLPLDDLP